MCVLVYEAKRHPPSKTVSFPGCDWNAVKGMRTQRTDHFWQVSSIWIQIFELVHQSNYKVSSTLSADWHSLALWRRPMWVQSSSPLHPIPDKTFLGLHPTNSKWLLVWNVHSSRFPLRNLNSLFKERKNCQFFFFPFVCPFQKSAIMVLHNFLSIAAHINVYRINIIFIHFSLIFLPKVLMTIFTTDDTATFLFSFTAISTSSWSCLFFTS